MWSIHVPCAAQYKNAVQIMLEDIDAVVRMVEDSGGSTLVTRPEGEWDNYIVLEHSKTNYTIKNK